jgi:small nuclear ribonucleoprotein (snRNP)-like protein
VEALHSVLYSELQKEADRHGIELESADVISQFKYIIRNAYKKTGEKVAVIIDEYDKPLLNTMDDSQIHVKMRDELKGFYGVLKSYDEYLKFVFLTGVTKFSHVSVFSDLNHLTDLTLDPNYAALCGITQEEMEQNFESEIADVLQNTGKTRETYLDELRRFYNGYRFSRKPLTVYNPFGLLKHFNNEGRFQPFWYESGTPTFLIKLIINQKINIISLNNLRAGYDDFCKYDIETMQAEPLLYQSGYLTIADYDEELNQFVLDYPNEEVRASFSQSLLEQYAQAPHEIFRALSTQLPLALFKGDIDAAMNTLQTFLASIPYDIIQERENYFQTAIHLIFTMLGLNSRSEVRIAAGRIDTLVETKSNVYCFEFKLNGSAEEALAQIDTKAYLLTWKGSGKKLFKVGVNFDREKRNIGEWKIKEE